MSEGLQVIGAGLHRTGSMSVKTALEQLGFGPCYHGLEALRRGRDGDHWLAAHEADGDVDWSVIFGGYRSTMDWPTIYFWGRLIAAHSDAKVLLTVRDPESWWDSHVQMFLRGNEFEAELTDEQRQTAEVSGFARMQAAPARTALPYFDGRVSDKAHCQQVFHDHNERVRQTVPADRLLVYRVQDGWEPLCRFLDVDQPSEPFPRVNVGGNLLINMRTAMRLASEQTEAPMWR